MLLTKKKTYAYLTKTFITFEQITTEILLVSIDNDVSDQICVPSYWRLTGSGKNPPFEIGINTETEIVKRIDFFVDLDCYKKFQLESNNT